MNLLPRAARQLGYAGLLPQLICTVYVIDGGKWQWTAQAMAFGYAEPTLMDAGTDWQVIDALLCLGEPAPRRRIEAEATAQGVRRVCFLTYDCDEADIERAAAAQDVGRLGHRVGARVQRLAAELR